MLNKILDLLNKKCPDGLYGYKIRYIATHPSIIILYYFNYIKWMYQRVRYGYDDRAHWDIAYYLSDVAIKLINSFNDNKTGIPINLLHGAEYDGEYEYTQKQIDNMKAEWTKILTDITKGFESAVKINNYEYSSDDEYKELEKIFDNGFELLHKYFFDLYD
jgi:hypothetical protein